MSKDSYSYIYKYFGIDNINNKTLVNITVGIWIMRSSLFVNVETSSLINSVHQIIYYVVQYTADSD